MKIYCLSCGGPTDYNLVKPLFCCCCGKSYTATASTPSSQPKVEQPKPKRSVIPAKPVIEASDDDDDDDDYDNNYSSPDRVPKITELDVTIEVEKARGENIENLIGTGDRPNRSRPAKKGKSVKSKVKTQRFLDEFRKEAGTLRKK